MTFHSEPSVVVFLCKITQKKLVLRIKNMNTKEGWSMKIINQINANKCGTSHSSV